MTDIGISNTDYAAARLAIVDALWSMGVRVPVETLDDLARLDVAEVQHGYEVGLKGTPEPPMTCNRSYWHGWRMGLVDAGHRRMDRSQRKLRRLERDVQGNLGTESLAGLPNRLRVWLMSAMALR